MKSPSVALRYSSFSASYFRAKLKPITPGLFFNSARTVNVAPGDTVCFAGFDTDDHLGYIVKPKYRGLGYAFEAAMGSIVYVKDIGLREVFLNVADENTASRRLAAKLGFKNIGGDEYRLEIC